MMVMRQLAVTVLLLAAAGVACAGQERIVAHTGSTGSGSLAEALNQAGDGDTIRFATGGTITLASGNFWVAGKNLTIGTADSPLLTINGNSPGGIFAFTGGPTAITFNNLTLSGGITGQGGAISAQDSDIYLGAGMTVSGNRATYDDGGGIFILAGDAHLGNGTAITNNTSVMSGGGIHLRTGNLHLGNAVIISGNRSGELGGGGAFVKSENTAGYGQVRAGDNVVVAGNAATGMGGGIYASGDVAFGAGARFENNQSTNNSGGGMFVTGADTAVFGDNACFVGNSAHLSGGGIFIEDGVLTLGRNALIENNTAATADGGGIRISKNALNAGDGTVIRGNSAALSGGGIFSEQGSLQFGANTEISDNSAGTYGGGVYALSCGITAGGGLVVSGNSAGQFGGGLATVNGDLVVNGTSVFSENSSAPNGGSAYVSGNARFAAAARFSQNRAAAAGGALYISEGGSFSDAVFADNSVNGSVAGTGLGGALYGRGTFTFTNGSFVNNKAAASASADLLSGKGGAIFIDAGFPDAELNLNVTADNSMRFSGNSHGSSRDGMTSSSIYFGSTDHSNGSARLNIDVAAGGELHMGDALGSQGAHARAITGNVSVDITKSGAGVWRLSGQNIMGGPTQWRINAGAFHLFAENSASQPTRLRMDGAGSDFIMAAGTDLLLTPFPSPMEIRAPTIELSSTTTVSLAGHTFGPRMPYGDVTILSLDAANTLDNQSVIPVTAGELEIGFYQYRYENLRWINEDSQLVASISDAEINRDFVCVCSVTGPMATVLSDASSRLVFERAGRRFLSAGNNDGCPRPEDGIWFSSSASHTDFNNVGVVSGYDLNNYTAALGLDKHFGDALFIGIAGAYSRPDFKGGKTRFDADTYTALAYGGILLPGAVEASLVAGYGMTNFKQNRRAAGEYYHADYDTRVMLLGAGLARRFERGAFAFKPFSTYEFIRLKTDGHNENGGFYSLTLAEEKQSLHRVRAGLEANWNAPGCMRIAGHAWYQGVFGDTRSAVPTYFTNDPDRNVFVNTSHYADRHSVGLGARLTVPLGTRAELGVDYAWIGGKDSQTHNGGLFVSVNW